MALLLFYVDYYHLDTILASHTTVITSAVMYRTVNTNTVAVTTTSSTDVSSFADNASKCSDITIID